MEIIMGLKFQKEFKKLIKKYKSLEKDLEDLKTVLRNVPTGNKSKHWNILKNNGEKYIFKIRLMCRSLKSSSFRIIYYYDGEYVELELIEIYYKGNKDSENEKRIEEIWKNKISKPSNK